jgi:hypothetical protein
MTTPTPSSAPAQDLWTMVDPIIHDALAGVYDRAVVAGPGARALVRSHAKIWRDMLQTGGGAEALADLGADLAARGLEFGLILEANAAVASELAAIVRGRYRNDPRALGTHAVSLGLAAEAMRASA